MNIDKEAKDSVPIYLDNAASTPLDPRITEALKDYLGNSYGNPSSLHSIGKKENAILSQQRQTIINSMLPEKIIFTSGGTEANNMAIMGFCGIKSRDGATKKTKHIVLGPMEHSSIYTLIKDVLYRQYGFELSMMQINQDNGDIDYEHLKSILREETVFVTQMWVSNLFGKIYDVEKIARIVKQYAPNASFHIDGIQALGKVSMNLSVFREIGIRTTVSLSGHKFHALKGVGALLFSDIHTFEKMKPLILGGGQEENLRSGTENVLGILSLGMAVQIANENIQEHQAYYRKLHELLLQRLKGSKIQVLYDLPNTHAIVPIIVPGAPAEVYLNHLMDFNICVSMSSACQAKSNSIPIPYYERGINPDMYRRVLRVSFSLQTTEQEVETFCEKILEVANKLGKNASSNETLIIHRKSSQSTNEVVNNINFEESIQIEERKLEQKLSAEQSEGASSQLDSIPEQESEKELSIEEFTKYKSIIVRWGELGLKGRNVKPFFLQLAKNIRFACKQICPVIVNEKNKRIFVDLKREEDYHLVPRILQRLKKVFGIANMSPVLEIERDLNSMKRAIEVFARKELMEKTGQTITFAVSVKVQKQALRTKENWTSTQYESYLGGIVINTDPSRWKVKLKNPEVTFGFEIRTDGVYMYGETLTGIGGLPTGIHGKSVTLLSGGFDSSVAAWMMMKRGCSMHYVSFWSHPYVGEKLVEKIKRLVKQLAPYNSGVSRIYLVPFTEIQEAIRDNCSERYRTILYRRSMNYVANFLANRCNAFTLVTGEALGQVASQTIKNISCIAASAKRPIFRPLIGMDKNEIIDIAAKIGTKHISAEDAPDCCTLFQPKNPITHGELYMCQEAEKNIPNFKELIVRAYKNVQIIDIDEYTNLQEVVMKRFYQRESEDQKIEEKILEDSLEKVNLE